MRELPPGGSSRQAAPDQVLAQLGRQGGAPDPSPFLDAHGPCSAEEAAAALTFDLWQRWHAGQRIPAEEYLRRYPVLASSATAALDVIYGEFCARQDLGEQPAPAEYLERFPRFADGLRAQFAVHQALEADAAQEGGPPSRRDTMHTTPASLLTRLRRPGDQRAWEQFVELYTPLLYHWARHAGLQDEDAADLVQDVFAALVQKMPHFVYDPSKSFRSWLRTVTLNLWRDNLKRRARRPLGQVEGGLDAIPSPEASDPFWEVEYRRHLVGRAAEVMRAEFQPTTWQACWEFVVGGKPAAQVAAELGLSENAVYVAKGRVLRRLRQELAGLLD